MRRLAHRVRKLGTSYQQASAAYHPYGTAATPMLMPTSTVSYTPDPHYPWGTAVYQDLHPVWAGDSGGQIVAGADNGPSGHVIPAGRLSPAHQ